MTIVKTAAALDKTTATLTRLATAVFALLLAACTNSVVVRGEFPTPVLEKLPLTLGIYSSLGQYTLGCAPSAPQEPTPDQGQEC